MTREERENAIRCLKMWIERETQIQTYKTCLEALEQDYYFWEKCPYYEPDMMFDGKDEYDMGQCKYKQEPCDDAISRQAVLEVFGDVHPLDYHTNGYVLKIQKLPPVNPQPKIGYWIEKDDNLYECSECGQYIYSETEHDLLEFHAFCGRCGAKMEERTK